MFENLQDKLQRAFKTLRGQGTVNEETVQEALREIRLALLEADVNFKVVKDLIEHIRYKALGAEVMTAGAAEIDDPVKRAGVERLAGRTAGYERGKSLAGQSQGPGVCGSDGRRRAVQTFDLDLAREGSGVDNVDGKQRAQRRIELGNAEALGPIRGIGRDRGGPGQGRRRGADRAIGCELVVAGVVGYGCPDDNVRRIAELNRAVGDGRFTGIEDAVVIGVKERVATDDIAAWQRPALERFQHQLCRSAAPRVPGAALTFPRTEE